MPSRAWNFLSMTVVQDFREEFARRQPVWVLMSGYR